MRFICFSLILIPTLIFAAGQSNDDYSIEADCFSSIGGRPPILISEVNNEEVFTLAAVSIGQPTAIGESESNLDDGFTMNVYAGYLYQILEIIISPIVTTLTNLVIIISSAIIGLVGIYLIKLKGVI